jgi:hypothetical protein
MALHVYGDLAKVHFETYFTPELLEFIYIPPQLYNHIFSPSKYSVPFKSSAAHGRWLGTAHLSPFLSHTHKHILLLVISTLFLAL